MEQTAQSAENKKKPLRSNIDAQTVKAIETVLAKGDRVELIPVKDGVKVVKVKRETVDCENHKAR